MKGNKEFKQECDQAIGSIAGMPKATKNRSNRKIDPERKPQGRPF